MLSRDSCLSMLNRAHAFPGPYVFKIIGDNAPELVARSVQVVVWVLGRRATPEVALRQSAGGRQGFRRATGGKLPGQTV